MRRARAPPARARAEIGQVDPHSLGTAGLPEIGSKSMVSGVLSEERALNNLIALDTAKVVFERILTATL